jgi:DNA polymerase IV
VRRILHCDLDCFYAAVHMRDEPSIRGKPVAVGGSPASRGVICAASYEARKFGVRSAIPSSRAVRLCPELILLRPDFSKYRPESDAVFAIYREFTEVIQTVSLDEAYLDVTDVWPSAGSATAIAKEIRRRVREERGLTVSVGVGPNRLVAKIASDFRKPDGLTVVPPHRVQPFLDPMPVGRLHGVGPATEKILHSLGARTIAELRKIPRERLAERLGSHGAVLADASNGIDERAVVVESVRKSLGSETTFAADLVALDRMDDVLDGLSTEVGEGLRKRGLRAVTLTVKVRYPDFTTVSRARTLPEATDDPGAIAAEARALLRRTEAGRKAVRLLGVTASRLDDGSPHEGEQLRLDF